MASATTPQDSSSGSEATRRSGSGESPLKSERGATSIDDSVVAKVAGIATREVRGVYAMGGGVSRTLGSMTQRVGVSEQHGQGVSVEVGEREAAADLTVVVEYGESIPRVAEEIRNNVIRRVEGITGLTVTEVNVTINDLHLPGDEEQPEETRVS